MLVQRPPHGIWLLGAAAAFISATALAQAPVSDPASTAALSERLARIERLLDSNALVELLQRVEALQREIQELRGEMELQTHSISQLRGRQRELYLDVDRRLQRVEVAGTTVPQPGTDMGFATPPANTAATSTIGPGVPPASGTSTVATTPAGIPTANVVPVAPAGGSALPATATASTPATVPGTAPAPAMSGMPAATPATGSPALSTLATVEPAAPPVDPVAEQNAYQQAFNLLKEGRYGPATDAFKGFLSEYPRGKYADNAQYWLGEAYYVTRQFEPALQEFRALVQNHPTSAKRTHAMLKIGYINDELGQSLEAQRILTELATRHPNTTAARLARERLQRIRAARR